MSVTVIPLLVVRESDAAIDFYVRALGAVKVTRYTAPDGAVVHADIRVGDALVALKDEDHVDRSPLTLGGTSVVLTLDVPDADAAARRCAPPAPPPCSRSTTCRTATAREDSPTRSVTSGSSTRPLPT